MPRAHVAILILAGISVLATVLGSRSRRTAPTLDSVNAWGGLAIAGAVLTAAPALGHVFGLTAERPAGRGLRRAALVSSGCCSCCLASDPTRPC